MLAHYWETQQSLYDPAQPPTTKLEEMLSSPEALGIFKVNHAPALIAPSQPACPCIWLDVRALTWLAASPAVSAGPPGSLSCLVAAARSLWAIDTWQDWRDPLRLCLAEFLLSRPDEAGSAGNPNGVLPTKTEWLTLAGGWAGHEDAGICVPYLLNGCKR